MTRGGGTGVRVTGGVLGGRRVRVTGRGVRPTSDRVRESVFSRLGALEGIAVLDLYAGTGILGIEAASRGAARVVFVERSARTVTVLRHQLETLDLAKRTQVLAGDAPRAVRRLGRRGERFDLVLLDPPYGGEELGRALAAVAEAGVLAGSARVVVEHGRRHPVPPVAGLVPRDERRYGETSVTWLEAQPRPEAGGPSQR